MAIVRNINVRSPFYTKLSTLEDFVTLELRIWAGDQITDRPDDFRYQLVKEQSGGEAIFELSELVKDFCVHTDNNISGKVWFETILADGVITPIIATYYASEGYYLYLEGTQHDAESFLPDFVALPEYSAGVSKVLTVPNNYSQFQIFKQPQDGVNWYYQIIRQNGSLEPAIFLQPNTDSTNQFITFNIGQDIAGWYFNLNGVESYVYSEEVDCNKYNSGSLFPQGNINRNDEPVFLTYVNKYGARNSFPFSLKHMESVSITSDTFQRNTVNYNDLTAYNGSHASRKRITDSKQSFEINTDWISEYFVKQLEELLLSEYVWASIPKVLNNQLIPVNIKTNKIEKKNHLNDKLIQYTMAIESASEYINTAR